MNKKNHAIVFYINRRYCFACEEMVINLQRTNPNLYDNVVIYHNDLLEEDKNKLLLLEPKCIFVDYSYEQWESEFKKPTSAKAKMFLEKYSHLVYVKYKVIELLEHYHKVLFLDCDMLVLDDISDIFELDGVAWRNCYSKWHDIMKSKVDKSKYEEYFSSVPLNMPSLNGGLFYCSDKDLDWKAMSNDGHDFIMTFMDYFIGAIDELAISYMVAKNNVPLTELDKTVWNSLVAWYTYDTKIVHFMGGYKVWENELLQTVFPQWIKNYNYAKKITQRDAEQVVEHNDFYLKGLLFERFWINILQNSDFRIPEELTLKCLFNRNTVYLHYTTNIHYLIRHEFYGEYFISGLRIRDNILCSCREFVDEIKSIENMIVTESETELYIRTKDRVLNFEEFYQNTFYCMKKYLSLNDEKEKQYNFLALNNEIKLLSTEEYFNLILSNSNRYTLFISCKDECSKNFNDFVKISKLPLNTPGVRESYIAVFSNNKLIKEASFPNVIKFSLKVNTKESDSKYVTIISEGFRYKKEKSCIIINNIDYSMNMRGLNFVVLDNFTGKVVDFFNIDTYSNRQFKINRSELFYNNICIQESEFLNDVQ